METIFNTLTEDNLIIYAAKHYYNPKCTHVDEFYEDLKRFKYIKRLINRYQETGKLSERLILNHLIVAFNVFGIEAGLNILELKLSEEQWPIVKPFLKLLNYIDEKQYQQYNEDHKVLNALKDI
jgi:hypothetical protein